MNSTAADEEDSNTIVDFDILEAAKENIQPLASGRSVTALSAILSTPHHQRDARLAVTRARMRAEVEAALELDDDPLQAYANFVHWTIENYPQGHSAESGILELLEEATRALKDDERCRNDMRYLKLWVLYASYIERPSVIYAYLLANDIGTDHGLLYEEYALAFERDGWQTKADEIYLLGIARRAAPLEHLRNRHRDFQKRMMASTALSKAEAPAAPPPPSTAPRRTVLGTTATNPSTFIGDTTSSTSRRIPVFIDAGASSAASPSVGDVFGPHVALDRSKPRPNARMPVFVDSVEGETGDVGDGNVWPELGTRKTRVKENIKEVSTAAGTKLKQRSVGVTGRNTDKPKIVPYRDPEPTDVLGGSVMSSTAVVPKTPARATFVPFRDHGDGDTSDAQDQPAATTISLCRNETGVTSPSGRITVPGSVMKQKVTKAVSEAEALRKDPFKNYKDKVVVFV